jgi:hypothetical protein
MIWKRFGFLFHIYASFKGAACTPIQVMREDREIRRKTFEEVRHGRAGFVWVKDKAGNEFVCRKEDLKNPKDVSEEDLKKRRKMEWPFLQRGSAIRLGRGGVRR